MRILNLVVLLSRKVAILFAFILTPYPIYALDYPIITLVHTDSIKKEVISKLIDDITNSKYPSTQLNYLNLKSCNSQKKIIYYNSEKLIKYVRKQPINSKHYNRTEILEILNKINVNKGVLAIFKSSWKSLWLNEGMRYILRKYAIDNSLNNVPTITNYNKTITSSSPLVILFLPTSSLWSITEKNEITIGGEQFPSVSIVSILGMSYKKPINSRLIYMAEGYNLKKLEKTFRHEIGHYFGLPHVFSKAVKEGSKRLLNSSNCKFDEFVDGGKIKDYDYYNSNETIDDTLPSPLMGYSTKEKRKLYINSKCYKLYKSLVKEKSQYPVYNIMSYGDSRLKDGLSKQQSIHIAYNARTYLSNVSANVFQCPY